MSVSQVDKVKELLESGVKDFRGQKLPGADFSGRDLRKFDFRGASIVGASFVGSDCTYACFEGANCYATDWTDAKLYRASFRDADLSESVMFPKDLYGVTVSLQCKSFKGMKVAPGYWFGWLFYALLMKPPSQDLEEKLIALMGLERYTVLREQYANRGY